MREPDNHTAWVDEGGDTWVRVDEAPSRYGHWWPLTDGPGWEEWARDGVGMPRDWEDAETYGPFVRTDPQRAMQAVARVLREVA